MFGTAAFISSPILNGVTIYFALVSVYVNILRTLPGVDRMNYNIICINIFIEKKITGF